VVTGLMPLIGPLLAIGLGPLAVMAAGWMAEPYLASAGGVTGPDRLAGAGLAVGERPAGHRHSSDPRRLSDLCRMSELCQPSHPGRSNDAVRLSDLGRSNDLGRSSDLGRLSDLCQPTGPGRQTLPGRQAVAGGTATARILTSGLTIEAFSAAAMTRPAVSCPSRPLTEPSPRRAKMSTCTAGSCPRIVICPMLTSTGTTVEDAATGSAGPAGQSTHSELGRAESLSLAITATARDQGIARWVSSALPRMAGLGPGSAAIRRMPAATAGSRMATSRSLQKPGNGRPTARSAAMTAEGGPPMENGGPTRAQRRGPTLAARLAPATTCRRLGSASPPGASTTRSLTAVTDRRLRCCSRCQRFRHGNRPGLG
jgi:hypothetical protein